MPDSGPASTASPLLATLAMRLRAARKTRGLSRRELSRQAGVSERYLAQMESGAGNASIVLLARVAEALDLSPVDLLEAPDPLARRVTAADAARRARIARILEPQRAHGGRIALIGLRGAGKSTLGPMLARHLGVPFHELNVRIAEDAGMDVAEVFALYGEAGYRRRERAALESLADSPPCVLAVAGGIVAEAETYELLLSSFLTVWLRATAEDHMARVRAQGDERPMQGNPQAMRDLREILVAREASYARAGLTLETSGRTPEAALAALLPDLTRTLDA